MLVRLAQPAYQTELILFLRNSGIKRPMRAGADAVRISDTEEDRLRLILETWRSLHPDAPTDVVSEDA